VCVERLGSERWRDVIKLIHSTRRLTQGWPCEPERRLVQGERTFFFMMGDAVSSAAGAERPDIFSEMTAAGLTSAERAEAWGALSSLALRWVLNPK
jgi:hypothetical protein